MSEADEYYGGEYPEPLDPPRDPPPSNMGFGDGVLGAMVWPTYIGLCNEFGEEPISDPDYERGSIFWEMEDGQLQGHGRVLVPKGTYPYAIYTHHPKLPKFSASQWLAHPFRAECPMEVDFAHITEADINPIQNMALSGG